MMINKLSTEQCANAEPLEKPYKLTDGGGLYLLVNKSGRYWRYDYRFQRQRKTLAIGVFPEVSLSEARKRHIKARADLGEGNDPAYLRKVAKLTHGFGETFSDVAAEWLEQQKHNWTSGHTRTVESRLNNDLLVHFGSRPINAIKPTEVLAALRVIEKRGAYETAHRCKTVASQVFRYGVSTGRLEFDPTRDLQGALKPVSATPLASIKKPERLGELMRAIDMFTGGEVVSHALQITPHVFLRPNELRSARWVEFNFKDSLWTIPAERMKGTKSRKKKHHVPLSRQVLVILDSLSKITGDGELLFPGPKVKTKPISDIAMNGALRRIGFAASEITVHGFRHTASTLLNEQRNFDADLIEAQLAHTVGNDVRRTYNQAKWLDQRRLMMQDWSDYLDELKATSRATA